MPAFSTAESKVKFFNKKRERMKEKRKRRGEGRKEERKAEKEAPSANPLAHGPYLLSSSNNPHFDAIVFK